MIKDMKKILKEFEPMVKDPKHLWNGPDIENFSLRPREAWGNWLLTAIFQHLNGDEITFMEDDEGDGVILDKRTGNYINTEHVAAMDFPEGKALPKGNERIIGAINHKIAKGEKYAQGKTLVVFFDGAGEFHRSEIRKAIHGTHHFDSIYCIGLLDSGDNGYEYIATEYKDSYGEKSISFRIKINRGFTSWAITQQKE